MTFSVREVSLGEVCEIKQGRYLSPNQMEPTPTSDCSVPVIGGNGVLGYTSKSTFPFSVPLVTCRGSRCGLMQWAEPPTWISNNAMAVYFKENLGDNFFLHQYLMNSSFDDVTTGSAQPQITVSNLSLKKILLPDLKTQKTIASVMRIIEEKIALNDLLSKTLENVAQTIFKSWFIDFDPVRAKMVGERPAGMDAATAALFPDSMVESEIGLIPKGWEVSELSSLVDSISDGDWIESKDQSDEGYRLLQIGNIGLGKFVESGKERYVSQETFKRLRCTEIMPGDVLVARMPDPTGRSWFVDSLAQPAITSVDVAIIRAHTSRHSNRYVSMFLNLPSTLKLMESLQTGSTRQRIKRTYIESLRMITPNAHVLAEFDGITDKLFGLSDSLRKESRALKEIRDSLFPRLISGELKVPEEMLTS